MRSVTEALCRSAIRQIFDPSYLPGGDLAEVGTLCKHHGMWSLMSSLAIGRYKAILFDRERYLPALLKYVHHNPARAKSTENTSRYRWSCDHAYRSGRGGDVLVDTDTVIRMYSDNRSRARQKYFEFMDDGISVKKQEGYATIDQRLLGEDPFVGRTVEEHGRQMKKERRKREYMPVQTGGVAAYAGEGCVHGPCGGMRLSGESSRRI